ncbi:SDR family NAD(P)-dependent oxidoreductase [Mesoterricola silvestris]|uniref:Oxidoreductase n=1 Tax=Mesoterricola silvestris TaxID=2927979 RepID=A0AA48GVH8_9BACT|nr:SDR family oxidoreductase [Mesoterricola silvestris]BDU74822.1 oxidoreductase [Mesoterricola silvestris]
MDAPAFTLVTGASSGIGSGVAVALAPERKLILHGRDRERLEGVRGACAGGGHLVWTADFARADLLAEELKAFLRASGARVSALVHCAGTVSVRPTRLDVYGDSLRAMNVNFFSAAEIIQVLLQAAHNGRTLQDILLISSIYSRLGAKGQGIYCATKGAADAYVRALAAELSPRVRVNSLLPGAVLTPMTEALPEAYLDRCRDAHPLGLGSVADVANYVEFLLSPKARWVTGQNIVADGGFSACKGL